MKWRSSRSAYRRSSAATSGSRSSRTAIGSVRGCPRRRPRPGRRTGRRRTARLARRGVAREERRRSPEVGPRLPKTIAWTVTAVPRSSAMPSFGGRCRARSPFQERKTASIAGAELRPRVLRDVRHADDVAEHRLETGRGRLRRRPRLPGGRREADRRRVVQAEVEDRVHHPRHRDRGSRADADEERVGGSPKPRPTGRLDVAPSARGARRRDRPASRRRGRPGRSPS